MNIKLISIGFVLLLFVIIFCGCNSQTPSVNTSISDIQNHSNRYINNTVTIMGKYFSGSNPYTISEGNEYIFAMDNESVKKPSAMVDLTEYKFTGIVRYGEVIPLLTTLYLEVFLIEKTQ